MMDRICKSISGYRIPVSSEFEAQEAIELILSKNELPYVREFKLSPLDRPDFFVDGKWAIEVKVGRSWSKMEVFRQIRRYARHEVVQGVILVHGGGYVLPDRIEGKPISVISLGHAWL